MEPESAESVSQSCTAADCSGGRGFQELELGQVQIRQHGAVLEKVVVELKAPPQIMPEAQAGVKKTAITIASVCGCIRSTRR